MTMAAAIGNDLTRSDATTGSLIVQVDIVRDLAAAEQAWRRLEANGLSTPYQRFDLISAWQNDIGACEGWQPFIIVGLDVDRQPAVVMPLVARRRGGVTIASFPGGKHSTFNMPLWRRDLAARATPNDIGALLRLVHAQVPDIDVLALERQPASWGDLDNPMLLGAKQPSVNDCPLLVMNPAEPPAARISNSFRRRLKTKERKLAALPGYRYAIVSDEDHIGRVLDAFFRIKPLRMAAQKLPNVFDEPGTERFVRDACIKQADGREAPITIHVLECDDEMIAMFAGVADGNRFSMMFNTYTMSENAKYSPGLILMRNIIDHYAERGYTSLDLGIGSDDYKRLFCKDDEPIFDSYLPLTVKGRLAAAALSSAGALKRFIKHTPALKRAAEAVRQRLSA